MTANDAEVLSAFFDGEAVEPDALAACLQAQGAIDLLLEFARLRRTAREDSSRPSEEFCEAMRERLARHDGRRRVRQRLVRLSLAASLAVAAALGGFSARALLERRQAGAPRPVTQVGRAPARVPDATPQAVSAPATKTPDQDLRVPSRPIVPSPTLRIRFAEWRDTVL